VTPPTAFAFARQRIIVADEDSAAVAFIVDTLQRDGHLVTRATDALCAAEDLALRECHLVISSMRVNGVGQVDAIAELHEQLPALPVLYLADLDLVPGVDPELPAHVTILRQPFTAEELRAAVRPLLPDLRRGSVLGHSLEALH
jgi:DNA-binding NtrC family response regulator